jgi:predicted nucleotidyltransferase
MDIAKIIKKLNKTIKKQFSYFRGSYLFGSRVRNDYREDSDVDIILMFDKMPTREEKMNIYDILCDLDYKYGLIFMGIPYTMKELKKNYIFHNEVVNKGIYYDAA